MMPLIVFVLLVSVTLDRLTFDLTLLIFNNKSEIGLSNSHFCWLLLHVLLEISGFCTSFFFSNINQRSTGLFRLTL